MWDAIWINANLATMATDGDYGIIKNGGIGVVDGKIRWLGAMSALPPGAPQELARQVHDVEGKWITPGLIDCHTHLVYGGSRAGEFEKRLNGATYAEISAAGGGILSTVAATGVATEDALYAAALRRLNALIDEGVTGVEIKSGYGLTAEAEAKMLRVATKLRDDSGLRVQRTFLGAHALPPKFKTDADGYIDHVCKDMLPAAIRESLVDAVDAFGEKIGFTPAQVARVFDRAQKYGLAVKLHADQLSDQGGGALAAQYQALSADHLEYASEDSIKKMAEAGTVAVLLPGAFYFLKETKLPPVDLMRQYHVPMAVATDCNPGSSPSASILLMMNMACLLLGLTPLEALQGTTRNAAKALGWQDDCGTLEKGKAADFAVWDISHPAELSYYLGFNPCESTILGGQNVHPQSE